MPAPFAALEASTARAVLRHLANAQASAIGRYGDWLQIPVVFDNLYTPALDGMSESAQPQMLASSQDVADLAHGCAVLINGCEYHVAGLQPDGTGMTTVLLERST